MHFGGLEGKPFVLRKVSPAESLRVHLQGLLNRFVEVSEFKPDELSLLQRLKDRTGFGLRARLFLVTLPIGARVSGPVDAQDLGSGSNELPRT